MSDRPALTVRLGCLPTCVGSLRPLYADPRRSFFVWTRSCWCRDSDWDRWWHCHYSFRDVAFLNSQDFADRAAFELPPPTQEPSILSYWSVSTHWKTWSSTAQTVDMSTPSALFDTVFVHKSVEVTSHSWKQFMRINTIFWRMIMSVGLS